jgi:prevent-host-death family protein
MKTVPVRELQQHSSSVVRRVRDGESVGITDRGTLVAVLVPPSAVGGSGALLASGRVRPATSTLAELPARLQAPRPTAQVLDELRAEG